jgi:hypothetical protein
VRWLPKRDEDHWYYDEPVHFGLVFVVVLAATILVSAFAFALFSALYLS